MTAWTRRDSRQPHPVHAFGPEMTARHDNLAVRPPRARRARPPTAAARGAAQFRPQETAPEQLQPEKVGVRTGSHCSQNKLSLINAIDKQPIRLDVALPMTPIIPSKCVIVHPFRQGLFFSKSFDYCVNLFDARALSAQAPHVLFELRRELEVEHSLLPIVKNRSPHLLG